MNSLFSRFGLLAVLVAILLPTNVIAQQEHIVDGDVVFSGDLNTNQNDSVRVINDGIFFNESTVANMSVEGGSQGQNESRSTVTGTFRVTGAGSQGLNYGNTALAEVQNGGRFSNFQSGTVGTFNLTGGNFLNMGTVAEGGTVSAGTFNNNAGASVQTLDQVAGTVHNSGTITGVTLSGTGTFENLSGGLILGSLVMNGGTVDNVGTINNLVYGDGIYNAIGNGSIGNLSLDAGQQFNVNRLATIADTFGVDSIDLAGANLVWNLNGSLGDNLGFLGWDEIFGVEFTNGTQIALFTINWDGGFAEFDIDNFGQTLTFGNYTVIVSMDGITANVVPEPATLAVIGLGLAGLGWARRRRA